MKKVIMLVLVLMVFTGTAFGEYNLDGMTREELTELYYQVSLALFGQKLTDGVQIYEGNYTIGRDLPAGRFIFRTDGFQEGQDETRCFSFVEAYDTEGKKISGAVGRMTYGSPVLLVDIPEGADYLRVGSSSQASNIKITIQVAEALWVAP